VARRFCWNLRGKIRIFPPYPEGSLSYVTSQAQQIFVRSPASDIASSDDERLEFFSSTILSQFENKLDKLNCIVFFPSYLDFVRLRDHLNKTFRDPEKMVTLSEYDAFPFSTILTLLDMQRTERITKIFVILRRRDEIGC